MKPRYLKKGDRVLIYDARHMSCFRNRQLPIYGRVKRINGGYIYVRPSWCKWDMEVYYNEIRVADKPLPKSVVRRYSQRPRHPQYKDFL